MRRAKVGESLVFMEFLEKGGGGAGDSEAGCLVDSEGLWCLLWPGPLPSASQILAYLIFGEEGN